MKLYNEEEVRLIANAVAISVAANLKDYPHVETVEETIEKQLKIAGIDDPGLWGIGSERASQIWTKGYTPERDVEINDQFQLSYVAGVINAWPYYKNSGTTIDSYIEAYCPENWNKAVLRHILEKPYIERVKIEGALCAAEITRYQLAGLTGEPYDRDLAGPEDIRTGEEL